MRTALLFAHQSIDDDTREPLGSELVGGIPIVLRQARQCRDIGLKQIFILVDRMVPGLAAAIEAIRLDGIDVTVIRSLAALSESLAPDDAVLVISEGLLVDSETLARALEGDPSRPLLAVWPAESAAGRLAQPLTRERTHGGVSLLPAAFLKWAVGEIDDWDPSTALPQAALHTGNVVWLDLDPRTASDGAHYWLKPEDRKSLASAERLLVHHHAVPDRMLSPTMAAFRRTFLQALVDINIDRPALTIMAVSAMGLAALLFALAYPWPGLIAAALGLLLELGSRAMRDLRIEGPPSAMLRHARAANFEYVWYLALGWALGGDNITAAATLVPLIALERRARTIAHALDGGHASLLGASPPWRLAALGIGALAHSWTAGLLLAAGHAAISLFRHQRRALQTLPTVEPLD